MLDVPPAHQAARVIFQQKRTHNMRTHDILTHLICNKNIMEIAAGLHADQYSCLHGWNGPEEPIQQQIRSGAFKAQATKIGWDQFFCGRIKAWRKPIGMPYYKIRQPGESFTLLDQWMHTVAH
jgi:hypothetical protein